MESRFEIREAVYVARRAKVYKAYDRQERRPVRLKALDRLEEKTLGRIRQAAERRAELGGASGLLPILECVYAQLEGLEGERLCLVSPLEGEETFEQYVQALRLVPNFGDILNREEFNLILDGTLAALGRLHAVGLVHGGLSLRKVLLIYRGSGALAAVRVADGGLGAPPSFVDQTDYEVRYGAPEQFAPSRFGKGGQATPSADFWAFGMALHNAFSKRMPFEGLLEEDGDEAIHRAIVGNEPLRFKESIPEPYRGMVERCLVREPSERPQSAEELREMLPRPSPPLSAGFQKPEARTAPEPPPAPSAATEPEPEPEPSRPEPEPPPSTDAPQQPEQPAPKAASPRRRGVRAAAFGAVAILVVAAAVWALTGGEEPVLASEVSGAYQGYYRDGQGAELPLSVVVRAPDQVDDRDPRFSLEFSARIGANGGERMAGTVRFALDERQAVFSDPRLGAGTVGRESAEDGPRLRIRSQSESQGEWTLSKPLGTPPAPD